MSEADNSRNLGFPEPLNSVNSTAADQAKTHSSDLPDQTLASVLLPEVQVKNRQSVNFPAFCSRVNVLLEGNSGSQLDFVKPTGNEMAALASSGVTELITLIQELHSSNSNSIKRVHQLEQALAECQEAIESRKKRSSVAEPMLTQRTQELVAAQEQVRCLFYELEASHQTVQRQQILIETLTAQLESSQERVAQLERECSLTQASYNQQSHQLVQTENTCRELRTRLTRQQRHTLQLKVALEKSLEVPVFSYQSQADTDVPPVISKPLRDLKNVPDSPPFLSQVQPMPPWSAQPQFFIKEPEPGSDSPLDPTPPPATRLNGENPTDSPLNGGDMGLSDRTQVASTAWPEYSASILTPQFSIVEWSVEYLSTPAEEEKLVMLEADDPPPSPPLAESSEPTIDLEELLSSELDTSELEEEHWQDLVSLLEAVEELVITDSPDDLLEGSTIIAPAPVGTVAQFDLALTESQPAPQHLLDIGSEQVLPQKNEFQLAKSPQLETSCLTPHTNWPSAVVYPLRPPKGRKSLAEIELPPFS